VSLGFTFGKVTFGKHRGKDVLKIAVKPKGRGLCSKCAKPAPCYDTCKTPREFQFIPFWGILVFPITAKSGWNFSNIINIR